MKGKPHKQKDILFILFSSLVVVIFWIASNLVHIWATTTISEEIQLQLTPIEGKFDTDTLQQLKTRTKVAPQYERPTTTGTPQTSPTPTETLSPLDEVVEEPIASPASNITPDNDNDSFLIQGQ